MSDRPRDGVSADELRDWLGVDSDAKVSAWLEENRVPHFVAAENRPVTTWAAIRLAHPEAFDSPRAEPPCALYRHYDKAGVLLYVGVSLNPVARLQQHRRAAHWFYQIARIEVEYFGDRDTAIDAESTAITTENPLHNIAGKPK